MFGLGAALALVGQARPAYDAWGWLVWGHQTLHWNLNLDGAPSWKPLAFIFTLPFSLTGRTVAMWLWIITACTGGVAAPLLAGRVAWRLAPRGQRPLPSWLAPALAAAIAAGATATMTVAAKSTPTTMGLLRQILIVTSDPLVLALWLGAVDAHLSRRHGWTLALLWLAGLGRPEVWVFLGAYVLWLALREPRWRRWAALALLTLPLAWFVAPAFASHSWMSAGNLDLNQPTAIQGDKFLGVLNRIRTLTDTTLQVEVAVAIVICLLRRNRAAVGLVAMAALWAAIEIAFALHGFSAVPRYMIEAGGLLAVVGGVGAAHAITWPGLRLGRVRLPVGLLGAAAVVAFLVAVVPFAHNSVNGTRAEVTNQKLNTAEFNGLNRLMAMTGGARVVRACGRPAVTLGWQSGLAWQLDLDVADVDIAPRASLTSFPVVYFHRRGIHWSVRLLNADPAGEPAACAALDGLAD